MLPGNRLHALAGDLRGFHASRRADFGACVSYAIQALGPEAAIEDVTSYVNARFGEASELIRVRLASVANVANYLIAHANTQVSGETLKTLIDAKDPG